MAVRAFTPLGGNVGYPSSDNLTFVFKSKTGNEDFEKSFFGDVGRIDIFIRKSKFEFNEGFEFEGGSFLGTTTAYSKECTVTFNMSRGLGRSLIATYKEGSEMVKLVDEGFADQRTNPVVSGLRILSKLYADYSATVLPQDIESLKVGVHTITEKREGFLKLRKETYFGFEEHDLPALGERMREIMGKMEAYIQLAKKEKRE